MTKTGDAEAWWLDLKERHNILMIQCGCGGVAYFVDRPDINASVSSKCDSGHTVTLSLIVSGDYNEDK